MLRKNLTSMGYDIITWLFRLHTITPTLLFRAFTRCYDNYIRCIVIALIRLWAFTIRFCCWPHHPVLKISSTLFERSREKKQRVRERGGNTDIQSDWHVHIVYYTYIHRTYIHRSRRGRVTAHTSRLRTTTRDVHI